MNPLRSPLISATAALFSGIACCGPASAADQKPVTYAQHVRPIFEKNCFKCHGPEKQKEGVRFDNLQDILSHGNLVRPGNSAGSGLIRVAGQFGTGTGKHRKVKAAPLAADEIDLLKAWIDQGAK